MEENIGSMIRKIRETEKLSPEKMQDYIAPLRRKPMLAAEEERKAYYCALQEKLKETEITEDTRLFSSEVLYWWAVTVRDVAYEQFTVLIDTEITVSMTSYPARIGYVPTVVKSILNQTWKADRVLLWLAEEQFPRKEAELPGELTGLTDETFIIRWCDDLKPHKKYYYAFQETKEGVIINFDDDCILADYQIELLLLSYIRHPEAVSSTRAHLMAITDNGRLLDYQYWIKQSDIMLNKPCMQLIATGVGGILYPVGIFSEDLYDKAAISKTCLMADDLWLKAHEVMSDIPVVLACSYKGIELVTGSQESSLWQNNQNENDRQMKEIIQYLDDRYGEGVFMKKLCADDRDTSQTGLEAYAVHIQYQMRKKSEKIKKAYQERKEFRDKYVEAVKQRDSLEAERQKLADQLAAIRRSRAYALSKILTKPFTLIHRPGKHSGE